MRFHASKRQLSAALLALVFSAVSVAGCKCNEPPLVSTGGTCDPGASKLLQQGKKTTCNADSECDYGYVCSATGDGSAKCCTLRACKTSGECCPGQQCLTDPTRGQYCLEDSKTLMSCTEQPCPAAQECVQYRERKNAEGTLIQYKRCQYRSCGAGDSCPTGLSCFAGACVDKIPCGGSCPQGSACFVHTDFCQAYSETAGRPQAACPVSCTAGTLATFKNPLNAWSSCNINQAQCYCAELPAIVPSDIGRFSSTVQSEDGSLLVSAYDGEFGDLVLGHYTLDGKRTALEYIDGVPDAPAMFGPNGPRKGITEPGVDVGKYTSLNVTQSAKSISYYDVTNKNLKFAVQPAGGPWASYTIDDDTGDVGQFSKITRDAKGLLVVAYYQRSGGDKFQKSQCPNTISSSTVNEDISALKIARAKVDVPLAASDWSIGVADCQVRPRPACRGCNGVCIDTDSGQVCAVAATDCATCGNSEVCASVAGKSTCSKKADETVVYSLGEGTGLFPALAQKDDSLFVLYQRRTGTTNAKGKRIVEGDLMSVRLDAQGKSTFPVLIDGGGDTGYFPDLIVDSTSKAFAFSYQSMTSRALYFGSSQTLSSSFTRETIDDGFGQAGAGISNFVGSDSHLISAATAGDVYALYQDATTADLKLAKRTKGKWATLSPISSDGAVGFHLNAFLKDGFLTVTHAKLQVSTNRAQQFVSNTELKVEHLTAP